MAKSLLEKFENVNKTMSNYPEYLSEIKFGVLDSFMTKINVRRTQTAARPATDLLDGLRTDTPEKQSCREAAAILDPKKRESKKQECKSRLRFWAISGYYATADAPRTTYAQLDFDHLRSVDDAKRVKDILIGLNCALIVSYSASGRGVFAIIDTGAVYDKATLKARCLDPVETILRANGIEPEPDTKLADDNVLDAGHGRVEAYDPSPYFSPSHIIFDADAIHIQALRAERKARAEHDRAAHPGFYTHPIHDIANALHNDATVGSIATAAAISFAASCLDVSSKRADRGNVYAARSYIVTMSRMGAGKTTLLEAITRARGSIDNEFQMIKPKSDAALSDCLKRCGTHLVDVGTGEKTVKKRIPLAAHEHPKNCMCYMDEAGKFLKSVAKNEKCGDMDSAFNQAFQGYFTPASTKSSMSDDDECLQLLKANATVLLMTTPAQWAEYAATEDETNGALRRRLIFFDDQPDIELINGRAPSLLELGSIEDDNTIFEAALHDFAHKLATIPKGTVFEVTLDALRASGAAMQALYDAGMPMDVGKTLIPNYATICAAVRCAQTGSTCYEVNAHDMAAVTDILRESVCSARAQVAERVEAQGLKRHLSEEEVWTCIREYLGDGKRRSCVMKWLGHRPPIFEATYQRMKARGEFTEVASGGKREKSIRLATDEEREAFEEKHQEAAKRANLSVWDGNTTTYAQADDEGKRKKLDAYLAEHEKEPKHELKKGQRDDSLWSLAVKLHNANMDDAFAEQWFYNLCNRLEDEFTQADTQRRLWRDRLHPERRCR